MTERRIEYLPLDEIEPEPRNPRAHKSIEDVKTSIRKHGFIDPIIKDERTGKLIAGHGRIEALQWMKDQQQDPPGGITVKGKRWLLPVVHGWSSADDHEAASVLLVLNRHAETGDWDPGPLVELLDELAAGEGGLDGLGFTAEDLDDFRAALDEIAEAPLASGQNESSYGDFLEAYTSRQVRGLVLDYDVDNYRWVLEALDSVRADDESNAMLVRRLLAAETNTEPPPLREDAVEATADVA